MHGGKISLGSDVGQAIKEVELENLILELNNDVDDIGSILRNIENVVYDVQDYIKGPVGDALISKLDNYKRQFDLLKSNLLSYPDDLLGLKISMNSNDTAARDALSDLTQSTNTEANKINQ